LRIAPPDFVDCVDSVDCVDRPLAGEARPLIPARRQQDDETTG